MKNAFNMVSCQALLSECTKHFPELYPWAHWGFSQHPFLWHTMGNLMSECGVQQGDPLAPLFHLFNHAWYMDDGVYQHRGKKHTTHSEEWSPSLGLHVNIPKCEVFCHRDLSLFLPSMKQSHLSLRDPPCDFDF